MSAPTAGPWRVEPAVAGGYSVHGRMYPRAGSQWGAIAEEVYGGPQDDEALANAHLIAAAPDLLAACEAAEEALGCNLQWVQDNTGVTYNAEREATAARYAQLTEAWRGLCAAIAKAREG